MSDDLNLGEFFLYIKNQILYFLLIIVIVLTLGSLYSLVFQKPQYTSSTTLILTGIKDGQSGESITTNDITLNSKLVTTYQEIIKSRKVLNQVVTNLKTDQSIESLAKMISVKNITGTEIIKISVTDKDNKLAKEVANELAKVFGNEVKEIYNVSNISILDLAEISNSPSNMSYSKQLCLYFIGGLFLAFLMLFVVYFFDTTIKTAEQVESKFGMTILGSVPDYNILNKIKKSKKGGRKI